MLALTNVENGVSKIAFALDVGASRTTNTTMRVAKDGLSRYRLKNWLLRLSSIKDPKIPLRGIAEALTLFVAQSFNVNGLDRTCETLFASSATTANRFDVKKSALSATSLVLDEPASVFLLDVRHRLPAVLNFWKAYEDVLFEAS